MNNITVICMAADKLSNYIAVNDWKEVIKTIKSASNFLDIKLLGNSSYYVR